MNNETEQAAEASSSEETRPSIEGVLAKTEPKDILNGLTNDLHNLILITISAVYYYDCFSILYLLRFFSQNQSTHAGIRVVLTANVTCILTHIFHSLPRPEPREFWNHGGLLVDFVGEKPTSRFKLLLLDFLILALQIIYLSLHYKKLTIDAKAEAGKLKPAQDIEAEEAGISRADTTRAAGAGEDIEMQSLLPDGSEERRSIPTEIQDDYAIILRKADLKKVFLSPVQDTGSAETTSRVQLFFQRLEAIRARRLAQEAQAQGGSSA